MADCCKVCTHEGQDWCHKHRTYTANIKKMCHWFWFKDADDLNIKVYTTIPEEEVKANELPGLQRQEATFTADHREG